MKTIQFNIAKPKFNLKGIALGTVDVVFGTSHFIAQSTADLLAETEGIVKHRIDSSHTRDEYADDRRESTFNRQNAIIAKARAIRPSISALQAQMKTA